MTPAELGLEPVVPTDVYHTRVWQDRDLNYLGPMPYSANWSQMGCFKTSTALWLLKRKKVRNALIITSKVGKGAYFSDFYRCLPESWELYNLGIHTVKLRVNDFEKEEDTLDTILATIKSGKHNHPMVLLAHYDVFTKAANESSRKRANGGPGILDKLRAIEWDMIICDEAHRLKNPKTQWTINIKRLKARNKHIMTGTGFVNNPAEIWSLLNFLHPTEWSGYWKFRRHFCDEYLDARGYSVIRGLKPGTVQEFRDLRKRLGPRHTMAVVHKGIDKPLERIIEVDLKADQKRMYAEIKATLQTLDAAGATLASPNVVSQFNRLRQICVATPLVTQRRFDGNQNRVVTDIELTEPSTKLDAAMDIIKELDDPEQKVVVFSNFRGPLDLLKVRLDKARINYVHMMQSDNEDMRYRKWSYEFRKEHNKVFLSTLALGGESINLTCAQYLIFLDRSWSPAQMMQAVGRVYRPGQKNAVEVIYINAKGTIDAYVKSKLDIKGKWFDVIFND